MGGTCGVAREGEGPQGVSFYFVSSLGSLLLVGSVIHMQYNTHGLYFMKRNNEKDRFRFPWWPCVPACVRTPCAQCFRLQLLNTTPLSSAPATSITRRYAALSLYSRLFPHTSNDSHLPLQNQHSISTSSPFTI